MRIIKDRFHIVECSECGTLYEFADKDTKNMLTLLYVECPKCSSRCFLMTDLEIKPAKPRIIVEGDQNENNQET